MKKNVIIYIAIIGFLLVGLAAAAIVAVLALRGATNPALEKNEANPTFIAFPTEESISFTPYVPSTTETEQAGEAIETATPEIAETVLSENTLESTVMSGTCNLSGNILILFIGQDEGVGVPPFGADAIRLVKYDFEQKRISIFSIPRDLLLDTPYLASLYGVSSAHLGDTYDIVSKREGTTPNVKELATDAVSRTIADNFGFIPDYYVNVDEAAMSHIVDSMNGIDVNIPGFFTSQNIQFQPGLQTLNGQSAWEYSIDPGQTYDEWDRFTRQDLVYFAIRGKMLDNAYYPNLFNLIQETRPSLLTNLGDDLISGLVCSMQEISSDQISSTTFPREMINVFEDHSMILKDDQAALQLMQDTLNYK